uniref:5'-Nucleotidase C-terminal domain-containing protein n=1 Tax=Globisporangium ultimum (strain ATCC 200006 / CBS 805.95 / DAOM BR144) TaxID=431595 RepID=K3WTG8_GLOUD
MSSARVVFLTLNDVYELLPDDDGRGGIAEFATLLKSVKQRVASDPLTRIIVTLNGDFLWRSELNRRDKGAHMIELLNYLGVEYVVLGNHEFDFGEVTLSELLPYAKFTTFGSNIRLRSTGSLLDHVTDSVIIPLANGLHLGMFGVCTVTTATDSFPSKDVLFESEVDHAARCVRELKAQGADLVVALTHVRLPVDKLLARQVSGIDLILGGHDHEPMTMFHGNTLIHKSGQDALWLGEIHVDVTRSHISKNKPSIAFSWTMHSNRGYDLDPACVSILSSYAARVTQEEIRDGRRFVLGISTTLLDGTRTTCRTQESNLGNFVTDAIRGTFDTADIAIINGGYIKGEKLHNAGLKITRKWISSVLEFPNASMLIRMRANDLRAAMLNMFSRYPDLNASFPQISGIYTVYDASQKKKSLRLYRDANHADEIADNDELNVATSEFVINELPGFNRFELVLMAKGPVIPDIVADFVQKEEQIAYPLRENRIVIID